MMVLLPLVPVMLARKLIMPNLFRILAVQSVSPSSLVCSPLRLLLLLLLSVSVPMLLQLLLPLLLVRQRL